MTTAQAPAGTSPPQWPASQEEVNLDALAAFSFLDKSDPSPERPEPVQPARPIQAPPSPEVAPAPASSDETSQIKSSFKPSKLAEERKLRIQERQAAHDDAVHKPGRSTAKQKRKGKAGAWGESSEEEEEEEEEDDDDADSDTVPAPPAPPPQQNISPSLQAQNGPSRTPQIPRRSLSPSGPVDATPAGHPASIRPIRHLPQIPAGRSPGTFDWSSSGLHS
jgi:CCR4-NOT transcriptional complex subunit CAF120